MTEYFWVWHDNGWCLGRKMDGIDKYQIVEIRHVTEVWDSRVIVGPHALTLHTSPKNPPIWKGV